MISALGFTISATETEPQLLYGNSPPILLSSIVLHRTRNRGKSIKFILDKNNPLGY
jgi:hypothetical protein